VDLFFVKPNAQRNVVCVKDELNAVGETSLLREHEFELETELGRAFEIGLAGLGREAACPQPGGEIVSGFSRYQNSIASLPERERAKLQAIAGSIVRSYARGCQPVRSVQLVGHADIDPQRERREPGYLERISRELALEVKRALERLINNRAISSRIAWNMAGAGASQLVVPNPRTELDRMRNRRVHIWLSRTAQEPDTPPYVRWLQSCLNRVLNTNIATNGILGPQTRRAISSFQRSRGLPASGIVTPETLASVVQVCGSANIPSNGLAISIDTAESLSFTQFFALQRRNLCLVAEIDSQPQDPKAFRIPSYRVFLEGKDGRTLQTGVTLRTGRREQVRWFHIGPGEMRFGLIPDWSGWDRSRQPVHPSLVGNLTTTESDSWPPPPCT
jgi:peptidoglycan hydrolase-like protein with peptidoglycan-binding domain